MNLKQMKAFREIMLTGSVSEAARNLNRTQPSISHQIAMLEDGLDMKLFERRAGRLHPVPEAQYLFEECKELLARIDLIDENMKRMKTMESGELRIVSMPGPSVFMLPEMISAHVGEADRVKVTLLSRNSDAVFQLLSAQQFDLGIADCHPASTFESSLIDVNVYEFEFLCALPASDPLASIQVVTPSDLAGRAMATLFPEHFSVDVTKRVFASEGCELNNRFVTQYFIPMLTYVRNAQACALVDPLTAESYRLFSGDAEDIVFRPFKPTAEFGVAVLTPAYRPASLLASSFSKRLAEKMTNLGGRRVS